MIMLVINIARNAHFHKIVQQSEHVFVLSIAEF